MPNRSKRGEQSSSKLGPQRMAGTHERVRRRQVRRLGDQHAQRRHQLVVQLRGGQQGDHRHRRHPGQRPAVGGAAMGPHQRAAVAETRQVGLVQHRHDRPVGGRELGTVLGLERLGDHQDVDVRDAGVGCHRHPCSVSAALDRAAPNPVTPQHRNTQRDSNTADDRCQPRIAALLSKSRQRIDENLAAFRCPHPGETRSPDRLNVGTSAGTSRAVVPSTSRRQLLGINLYHDAGTRA